MINDINSKEDSESENLKPITAMESNSEEKNDYIKYIFFKNLKENIIIVLFTISVLVSEIFYRDPLFNYSLSFEKNWQNDALDSTIIFFKIVTKVGGEYLMGLPVAFVICFCSLIKSSVFIAGLIFCLHFHSMMKIWYGSSRPFWENIKLYKGICDGGFGNPSGHSITSAYLYLTLFMYIKDAQILKGKTIAKTIIFLLFLTYIILIILSRLILGVHAINQVIYGSTLGVIVMIFSVKVFKLHQMPVAFYKRLFKEKLIIFCVTSILLLLTITSVLSVMIFNNEFDYKKYEEILSQTCGDSLPKYRKFNYDGLFGAFTVLALLGMYLGQILFWYLIDNRYKKYNSNIDFSKTEAAQVSLSNDSSKDEENNELLDNLINNWNKNRRLLFGSYWNIFKIMIVLELCMSPTLLFILISKDADMSVIFIYKFGFPFFAVFFLIFSFGFYYFIMISCGTKEDLLNTEYLLNERNLSLSSYDDNI
jgi:membrane-associated phospholipid phosphatase